MGCFVFLEFTTGSVTSIAGDDDGSGQDFSLSTALGGVTGVGSMIVAASLTGALVPEEAIFSIVSNCDGIYHVLSGEEDFSLKHVCP